MFPQQIFKEGTHQGNYPVPGTDTFQHIFFFNLFEYFSHKRQAGQSPDNNYCSVILCAEISCNSEPRLKEGLKQLCKDS